MLRISYKQKFSNNITEKKKKLNIFLTVDKPLTVGGKLGRYMVI